MDDVFRLSVAEASDLFAESAFAFSRLARSKAPRFILARLDGVTVSIQSSTVSRCLGLPTSTRTFHQGLS